MSESGETEPEAGQLIDFAFSVVQATGDDFAVTLVVSGVVITGLITPWIRYQRWERETLMRTSYEGGHFVLPTQEAPPYPVETRKQDAAEWKEMHGAIRFSPDRFCVSNAELQTGMRLYWVRVPFLVVKSAAVEAFSPGCARDFAAEGLL